MICFKTLPNVTGQNWESEEQSDMLDSFRDSESNASPVLLKISEYTGKN